MLPGAGVVYGRAVACPSCEFHSLVGVSSSLWGRVVFVFFFFFFNDTATTEIYTLSLHDALPIYIPL